MIMKKLIIAFLTLFTSLANINKPVVAHADSPYIETTSPLSDLLSDQEFAERYNSGMYLTNSTADIQLIRFSEYAFDSQYSENFGLYLYIYNPNPLRNFIADDRNEIELNTSINAYSNSYSTYKLSLISKENSGTYLNKFYKFKINIDKEFYDSLNKEERHYNIASIELLESGRANATDFTIGSHFVYSGYAKGMGGSGDYTLHCETEKFDVIEIRNLGKGYYRTATNSQGIGHHTDMFYVYYYIPTQFLENYGKLIKMHCEYYKVPIVYYNVAKQYQNANIKDSFFNRNWLEYTTSSGDKKITNGDTVANLLTDKLYVTDDVDTRISAEEIESCYDINSKKIFGVNAHTDEFYNDIELCNDNEDQLIDLLSYGDESDDSDFTKWWNSIFHSIDTSWHSITNLKPIEEIKEKCANDGSTYTIAKEDVESFNKYYDDNKSNGQMYLFRFSTAEVWTSDLVNGTISRTIPIGGSGGTASQIEMNTKIGNYFEATAIIDFDVIDMTFLKNGVESIVPVTMSPVNIFTESPSAKDDVDNSWWLYIVIAIVLLILLIILAPQLILMLIKALAKGIVYLFKGLIVLLKLPFKLINLLFKKSRKKKRKKANNYDW